MKMLRTTSRVYALFTVIFWLLTNGSHAINVISSMSAFIPNNNMSLRRKSSCRSPNSSEGLNVLRQSNHHLKNYENCHERERKRMSLYFQLPKSANSDNARISTRTRITSLNSTPSPTKTRGHIPLELIKQLSSQKFHLPYPFELSDDSLFCIRHLEKKDLGEVVRMCVKEFGSYTPPSLTETNSEVEKGSFDFNTSINDISKQTNSNSIPSLPPKIQSILDEAFTTYENFVFAFIVQLGLDQRIERRQEGEDPTKSSILPDHNVLCLVKLSRDPNDKTKYQEEILGISEVSVQPLIPNRTAPPFILPLSIKRLLSQMDANSQSQTPVAYVSNVLVKETKRGLGYGKILMAASEGRAKAMGYDSLFLHVDANQSGSKAQSLYWGLGFENFVEDNNDDKESPFAWMGNEFVEKNRGLYLVDGVPLLYLKKKLKLDKDPDTI